MTYNACYIILICYIYNTYVKLEVDRYTDITWDVTYITWDVTYITWDVTYITWDVTYIWAGPKYM